MDVLPNDKFDHAFKAVLSHEGGYTFDADDPGGPTKYGVTQADVNQYWAAYNFPKDVKNLTEENARTFYKVAWWNEYHFDKINSLSLSSKIFDLFVNVGNEEGAKIVQRSCNEIGYTLLVDGAMGNNTISAVNEITFHNRESNLIHNICQEQKNFYESLVQERPELEKFLKGWLNRAAYQGT